LNKRIFIPMKDSVDVVSVALVEHGDEVEIAIPTKPG
jgi:hypothetical protein